MDPTLSFACSHCGGIENVRRCGGCRHVSYCNAECQQAHWKTHSVYCNETVATARAFPAPRTPFLVKPFSKTDPKTRRPVPSSSQDALLKGRLIRLEKLIDEGSKEMRRIEDASWKELEVRPWKSKQEALEYLGQEKAKQNQVAETMRVATDQLIRQMLFQAGGTQGQIAYWESQFTRMRAAVMEQQMQAVTGGVPVGSTVNERIGQHWTKGWAVVHTILGTLHEMDNEQNSLDVMTRYAADIALKTADIRLRMAEDEGEPDLDLPTKAPGSTPHAHAGEHSTAVPAASKIGGFLPKEAINAYREPIDTESESVQWSMRGLFKNTRTTWSEEAQFIADCLQTHGGDAETRDDPVPISAETGMGMWMNEAIDAEMYAASQSNIMQKQGISKGFAQLAQKLRWMEGYINNNAYTYNCAVALTGAVGVALGLRYGYADTKISYQADLDRIVSVQGDKEATKSMIVSQLEEDQREREEARARLDSAHDNIREMTKNRANPEIFFANHMAVTSGGGVPLPGSVVCRLRPEVAKTLGFNQEAVMCDKNAPPPELPSASTQSRIYMTTGDGDIQYAGSMNPGGGMTLPPLEARAEFPTGATSGTDVVINMFDPHLDGVAGQSTLARENDLIYPQVVTPDFDQFWGPSNKPEGVSPLAAVNARQAQRFSAQQAANFANSQIAPYPSVIHDMMLQQAQNDPVISKDQEISELTARSITEGFEIVERRLAQDPPDMAASFNALFAYIGAQRSLVADALEDQAGYDMLEQVDKEFAAIRLRYETIDARVLEETERSKALFKELTTLKSELESWNIKQKSAPANVFDAFSSDINSLFGVSASTRMLYKVYVDNSFTAMGNMAQKLYEEQESVTTTEMFRNWATGATIIHHLIQSLNILFFVVRRVLPGGLLLIARLLNAPRNWLSWQGIREQEIPTMRRYGRKAGRAFLSCLAVGAFLLDTAALSCMMIGSIGGKWVPIFLGTAAVFANLLSVVSAIGALFVAGGGPALLAASGSLVVSVASFVMSVIVMNPRKMDLMSYIGGNYAQCMIAIMNLSGPVNFIVRAVSCLTPFYDSFAAGNNLAAGYFSSAANIFLQGPFGWSSATILPLGFLFLGNRWQEMVQDFGVALSRGTLIRRDPGNGGGGGNTTPRGSRRRAAAGIPDAFVADPYEGGGRPGLRRRAAYYNDEDEDEETGGSSPFMDAVDAMTRMADQPATQAQLEDERYASPWIRGDNPVIESLTGDENW